MQTAYYANKRPIYEEMLADGKCRRIKWSYALRQLARALKDADGIYAFNSRFDTRSIAKTCETIKAKNPTADGISDIWKGMANPNITQRSVSLWFPPLQTICSLRLRLLLLPVP